MQGEKVQGQLKFNQSRPPLIGSWPVFEVIGVPLPLRSVLSATTLFVSNLSCWNIYQTCPSSPLPSLAKSFLQPLPCLCYNPSNMVAIHLATSTLSLLQFTSSQSYESACSPGHLLSLISPSLSSPQRKLLYCPSIVRLTLALVARSYGRFICGTLSLIVYAFRYSV